MRSRRELIDFPESEPFPQIAIALRSRAAKSQSLQKPIPLPVPPEEEPQLAKRELFMFSGARQPVASGMGHDFVRRHGGGSWGFTLRRPFGVFG